MSNQPLAEKYNVLTVDRCNSGRRGILAHREGSFYHVPVGEPVPDEDWVHEKLGMIDMILDPKWVEMTPAEAEACTYFQPLAEYQNAWGIAMNPAQLTESERIKADASSS